MTEKTLGPGERPSVRMCNNCEVDDKENTGGCSPRALPAHEDVPGAQALALGADLLCHVLDAAEGLMRCHSPSLHNAFALTSLSQSTWPESPARACFAICLRSAVTRSSEGCVRFLSFCCAVPLTRECSAPRPRGVQRRREEASQTEPEHSSPDELAGLSTPGTKRAQQPHDALDGLQRHATGPRCR